MKTSQIGFYILRTQNYAELDDSLAEKTTKDSSKTGTNSGTTVKESLLWCV